VIYRRLLGLAALVGAVAAVVLLWQRPDPFAKPETIRADVTDASGLAAIGADVRVAGVPVGRVTAIRRTGNVAQLTLTINPFAGTIHRDATLALRPRLLFEGTAYVSLTLGSSANPPLGNEILPTSQTSTYVPLDQVLSAFQPHVRASVRVLASASAGMLSGAAPGQLRQAITAAPGLLSNTAVVARAVRGPNATQLRSAIDSLGHVAFTVAARAPALRSSLGHAAHTFRALHTGGGQPLAQTLSTLPSTTGDVRRGATAASGIEAELQTLIPRLRPGVSELAPTISATEPLLGRVAPVATAIDPLLSQAQTALTDAANGSGPAVGAIDALMPTLNIFQNTLLGALERRTDLGDAAYQSFLGLFAGGGGASRPFGVAGEGHFMRFGLRFLTGAGQPLPPCNLVEKISPSVAHDLEAAGGCTPS
jgi:ABC-type transporter Mla subunit MlaD